MKSKDHDLESLIDNSLRYVVSGHFYIIPLGSNEESCRLNGKEYQQFQVLNESKQVVDVYDFIDIDAFARIDIEDGVIRIFPHMSYLLGYDLLYHRIISRSEVPE